MQQICRFGIREIMSQTRYNTAHTLDSGINVGPRFINFDFFPGRTTLLKALRLLSFQVLQFIILAKICRPYVYPLPYVYFGVYSKKFFKKKSQKIKNSYPTPKAFQIQWQLMPIWSKGPFLFRKRKEFSSDPQVWN